MLNSIIIYINDSKLVQTIFVDSIISLSLFLLFVSRNVKKWKKRVSSESITDGIVKGDGDEVNWIFLENKPDNFFECSVRKSTNTTTIWSAFDI